MSEGVLVTTTLQQEMSIMLVIKIPSPVIPFGLFKNYPIFIFIYCVSEYVPSVMSLEVRTGFGFPNWSCRCLGLQEQDEALNLSVS